MKQALLDTGGLTNPEVLDAIKRLKIQTDIGDQIETTMTFDKHIRTTVPSLMIFLSYNKQMKNLRIPMILHLSPGLHTH